MDGTLAVLDATGVMEVGVEVCIVLPPPLGCCSCVCASMVDGCEGATEGAAVDTAFIVSPLTVLALGRAARAGFAGSTPVLPSTEGDATIAGDEVDS